METVSMLRRQIKKDAKRIEKIKRDKVGKFAKTTNKEKEVIFGRRTCFWTAIGLIVVFTSIVLDPNIVKKSVEHIKDQRRAEMTAPVELLNPFIGVETTYAMSFNSNSIQAEIKEDTRVQDCTKQGGDPLILDDGFECALPAK